ncbi:MAG: hypothetical protein JNG82_07605 [Opitutaceae bacterium]|nr:hypothetical protein [Opitutaceae bacterium]
MAVNRTVQPKPVASPKEATRRSVAGHRPETLRSMVIGCQKLAFGWEMDIFFREISLKRNPFNLFQEA